MLTLLAPVFFGYGLYQVLHSILKLPDDKLIKLEKRFQNSKNKSFLAKLEDNIYAKILKYIKFDEIKEKKLKKTFLLANIDETPEQYYAGGIASALTKVIISFITIFMDLALGSNISIIAIGGMIVLSVIQYFKYIRLPYKQIEKNKLEIEEQMYPFVINIEQELLIDTDIIRILENFKGRCKGSLKKHLEITLSEARVSNVVNALVKMESRINSTMVSDVIRGLIALSRGENNREYFSMLSSSFKTIYINQKRKEASLMPSKITKYTMMLILALIILVIGSMVSLVNFGAFTI